MMDRLEFFVVFDSRRPEIDGILWEAGTDLPNPTIGSQIFSQKLTRNSLTGNLEGQLRENLLLQFATNLTRSKHDGALPAAKGTTPANADLSVGTEYFPQSPIPFFRLASYQQHFGSRPVGPLKLNKKRINTIQASSRRREASASFLASAPPSQRRKLLFCPSNPGKHSMDMSVNAPAQPPANGACENRNFLSRLCRWRGRG